MMNIEHPPIALQPPHHHMPIRFARLTDADPLRDRCWPNRTFMTVYSLLARSVRNMTDARGLALVLTDAQDTPMAFGQYTVWPTCAEISDLVVAEPLRGQGLGTILIQELVYRARQQGVTAFEIGAALDNPRALDLYRHLGFEDSHTLVLSLDRGREKVQFLRLDIVEADSREG